MVLKFTGIKQLIVQLTLRHLINDISWKVFPFVYSSILLVILSFKNFWDKISSSCRVHMKESHEIETHEERNVFAVISRKFDGRPISSCCTNRNTRHCFLTRKHKNSGSRCFFSLSLFLRHDFDLFTNMHFARRVRTDSYSLAEIRGVRRFIHF